MTDPITKDQIDRYAANLREIKRLQDDNDNIKKLILSSHDAGDCVEGNAYLIRIKPGSKRFKDYTNKDVILSIIAEQGLIDDCIKLNKTSITKHIKSGALTEEITDWEITEESAPSLVVEEANTWESLS